MTTARKVDETALRSVGLANGRADGIKILGTGELSKKLTVSASAFSASAKAKIEAKGGTVRSRRAANRLNPRKLDAGLIHVPQHLQHLRNCFKIPELKSRILFTLGVLAVCRLMALHSAFPAWMAPALRNFSHQSNGRAARSDCIIRSPAARSNVARSARSGIMPYISATIIIQLLTAVWPHLSKLAREEGGRTKIIQYGRYLTVLLCLGQGLCFAIGWEHPEKCFAGLPGLAGF